MDRVNNANTWRTHSCVQRSHSCERDMFHSSEAQPQPAVEYKPMCYDRLQ
jgi:hypothetical protein